MKSDRTSLGLSHFTYHLFSQADATFTSTLATESKPSLQTRYYQAVSRFGALLDKRSKENKSSAKTASLRALLAKKSTVRAEESKEVKEDAADRAGEKEIVALLRLFESLQQAPKSSLFPGVDYAIKTLTQLVDKSNSPSRQRFAIELAKFKVVYATRLRLINDLEGINNRDESFFSRLFNRDNTAKKLHQIIHAEKPDPLFLTPEQLSELYRLWQDYHYDKKYDTLFAHLEKQLLMIDFISSEDACRKFWKNFKGTITLDKVAIMREMYSESSLRELLPVLKGLQDKDLLTDRLFSCLLAVLLPNTDCRNTLTEIDAILTDSPVNNPLQAKLCEVALDRMVYPSLPESALQRYISHVKNSSTLANGRKSVAKIVIYLDLLAMLASAKNNSLEKIVDLMRQAEDSLGKKSFRILCQKVLAYRVSPSDFITIMNTALQLRKESADDLFNAIDENQDDSAALRHQLNELVMRDYYLKFPERSLEEVTQDFLTLSTDVEFPLKSDEFYALKARYLQIKTLGDALLAAGEAAIQSALSVSTATLARNPADETAQLTLLAIIRLQIKFQFGINPYNIQMLNVLALLNQPKRIAQIKTGEGKSTLIAILAAYHALTGRKADIITTSHDLAIRDAKKYKNFYRALGLTSAHNVREGNRDDTACYHQDIVYGTVADFEFAYLRRETGTSEGRGDRPYDVVIGDEVDSMFIDMQRNEAILSRSTEAGFSANVYRDIWEWINHTERQEQTTANLQALLKAKGIDISPELAKTWLKSARSAQHFTENKEYIVANPSKKTNSRFQHQDERVIKIVNKSHTGEVQSESTRWQGGLHEFLEAKHQLRIHTESLTSASISHIEFFNKYKTLSGLTGTLGAQSCRNELQKLYHVDTYDSPPYKPSRKKPVPHVIVGDEKEHTNAIIAMVKNEIKAGRPVLILCESIEESQALYEQLSRNLKSVSLYNGVQEASAEEILGLAGNPGAVTIATNLAGRGSDIVVTPEAEASGGLHVAVTFPALNRRVEQQAFGRTGRQGRQGTFQYILHEEQLSDEENAGKTTAEKIQILREVREKREEYTSQTNQYNYNLMHKLFILQHVFFCLPEAVKFSTMAAWSEFKTESHKYTVQYLRDELDDASEDTVFQTVLAHFAAFWQKHIASADGRFTSPETFIHSRLKEACADAYTKTLLIRGLVLLDNPQFDFSTGVSDLFVEMQASQWGVDKTVDAPDEDEMEEKTGSFSKLMQFYQTSSKAPVAKTKEEPDSLMKGLWY